MANELSDLEVLLPGREVSCKGERIKVLPLFFGQYPKAVSLMKPLASVIQQSGMMTTNGASLSLSTEWLSFLPAVFDQGGEALIQFFAFAINKKRDWFDTLPADEGLALGQAIFEENRDFFVRRILPMLTSMGLVKVTAEPDGAQSLQTSTVTDTPGNTSNG